MGADLTWPAKPVQPPIAGIPPGLLSLIKGPINVEQFLGDETADRSAEDYFTLVSGGAVFTSLALQPKAGDAVSRGLWELQLDADPIAPVGLLRRQERGAIASDGFSADRPTLWAMRFRVDTAKPTAATYEAMAGGLVRVDLITPVQNGIQIVFDPTIGVDAWVCRPTRASVDGVQVSIGRFSQFTYHVVGFVHAGDRVIPFFDGAIAAALTSVEIQPAGGIGSVAGRLVAAAAGLDSNLVMDWVAWGS